MTLTEFLLARIAEDEERSGRLHDAENCGSVGVWVDGEDWDYLPRFCDCGMPQRILAECEAKRRIVAEAASEPPTGCDLYVLTRWEGTVEAAQHLAAVYAEHPDYRDEWRP